MEKSSLFITNIPSILWGNTSDKLLIAVHGNQSHKSDVVIEVVAKIAIKKGYQVLSFDLPEHGDRKEEARLCDAQNCTDDLMQIMKYARTLSDTISIFACSIGAYFSMLAWQDQPIQQAFFLSPVVDMKRLIENMMKWFDVSVEQLEQDQKIYTPINTLYWHYYQYVVQHPLKWDKPTALLYGSKDELTEFETINAFSKQSNVSLTVLEGSEHFFHTAEQLRFFESWLQGSMTD